MQLTHAQMKTLTNIEGGFIGTTEGHMEKVVKKERIKFDSTSREHTNKSDFEVCFPKFYVQFIKNIYIN